MFRKRKGQIGARFAIYTFGLLVLALGIVLLIKSGAGATPWDVFQVGLYYNFGLTIGTWSIIVGFVILAVSAILTKEIPHIGAFLNMILVGVFIDMYMMIPFLQQPPMLVGKLLMFICGVFVYAYGMGIYISASLGAGPRDSLMGALIEITGWKIRNVRGAMEIIVLLIGSWLGGPVNWGSIVFSLVLGPIAGFTLPQCNAITDTILDKLKKKKEQSVTVNKGA